MNQNNLATNINKRNSTLYQKCRGPIWLNDYRDDKPLSWDDDEDHTLPQDLVFDRLSIDYLLNSYLE